MGDSNQITIFILIGMSLQVYGELSKVIGECVKPAAMCATIPADCLTNTTNCIAAAFISLSSDNDTLIIQYSAVNDYKYIALGFSNDKHMGEEVVVDCIMDAVGKVNIYSAYNVGHKHFLEATQNEALTLIGSGIFDGIYCNYEITGELKVSDYAAPAVGSPTYVILAVGQTKDGKPYHHELTAISKQLYMNSSKNNTIAYPILLISFLIYISTF